MKVMLDEGAFEPLRLHETDAGLDLRAMHSQRVYAGSGKVFHTGVHIELPPGTAGVIMSRSGLNMKHNITTTGLVDESFRGEIRVKLYNHGIVDYDVKAGDRIAQLVVVPVRYESVELVDSLDMDTERGENGFGSTGK